MATGGIGGYLAVKLTQAGHQVACVARGAHLSAIQTQGLKLNSPLGQEVIRPWKVSEDPAEIGPVDAIIFGVKAAALDQAASRVITNTANHRGADAGRANYRMWVFAKGGKHFL